MRKILIVVDMQNDFVTGALGSEDAQKILPGVRAKIDAYHKEDAEVIFTRDTHGEDYMQTNEGKHLPVPHCIKGTDGWQICSALTDGLFAEKDYTVVDKPSFGYIGWREVIAAQEADGSDPCPVAVSDSGGNVHSRFIAQLQDILHLDHRKL